MAAILCARPKPNGINYVEEETILFAQVQHLETLLCIKLPMCGCDWE